MEGKEEKVPLTQSPPLQPQTVFVQHVVVQPDYSKPQPRDYLFLSLFSTFCCFWPIGLFAIIKSLEVRSAYYGGRLEESASASRLALTLNKLSILIGVVILVAVLFLELIWIIPVGICCWR